MTTWILLRGLTRESGHWGDFVDCLRQRMTNARLIALDLPGNGALNHLPSPSEVSTMAEHCRTALARDDIRPPYSLLAMSLGAMVAVAWAAAEPSEITRCVLINTSLRPFSPFYRRLRPRNYPRLLRFAMPGASERERETLILRMTSRLHVDNEGVLRDWIALRAAHPVSAGNALRQLHAAARYRAPAERPVPPMLILASRHDGLVHPGCSAALAEAWGCKIRVHPAAGHDLPLDDGPWLADEVARWVGPESG